MSENSLIQFLNQYNTEVDLPSVGQKVTIKPITTGQMKKILSYEGSNDNFAIENILDDVINGCVTTADFKVDSLTLQDRFDLLINIRKITKGNDYTFTIKCPDCKTELINHVNIDELKSVPFPTKMNTKVELSENLSVHLSHVTRGIQKEAVRLVKKQKNLNDDQQIAEIGTYIYALAITKFDTPAGEISDASTENKKELLDNLSEKVFNNITKWYTDHDYGITFQYKPKCRFCEWEDEDKSLPLTGFFF